MNLETLIRKGRVRGLSDEHILNGIRFHYDMYVAFIQDKPVEFRLHKDAWYTLTAPQFKETSEYRLKPVEDKIKAELNDHWSKIPAGINYIAKDIVLGGWWGFSNKPLYNERTGYWKHGEDKVWPLYHSDVPPAMHRGADLLVRPNMKETEKPDWSNIPNCFKYIAKDYSGQWWGFTDHPDYDEIWGVWVCDSGVSRRIADCALPKCVKEEDVLLKRPL